MLSVHDFSQHWLTNCRMDYGEWTENSRGTYNKWDGIARSTTQVCPHCPDRNVLLV